MIVKAGPAASKNPAKTFAGLLRASLADGKSLSPETTVYAFGDPKWFHHTAGGRETASEVEAGFAAPAAPLRIELKKTPVRRRHLERKPPSSLEGGKRIKLSDVFGRENMAAIHRGLVMHAWLAQIEWLDPKSPGGGIPHDDALRRIGNEAAETAIDLDPLIAEFRGMLDKPAVAAAMRRETYRNSPEQLGMAADVLAEIQSAALRLTVQNERRFAVREGDAVVLGHVDRLVLLHDGAKLVAADVIDFKTDVLPSKKSFKDRVAFYRPQLEAYRRSLAKTLRLTPDRIAARMLFLDAGTSILVE
jgi:ATP-dependent exoDNAse (exonuclease V) beta subunit